jgi:hypothetical protein
MRTNSLARLHNDELDAIATHAGCLLEAIRRIDSKDLLPELRNELTRLEDTACQQLVNRGVIADWTAEFDSRS